MAQLSEQIWPSHRGKRHAYPDYNAASNEDTAARRSSLENRAHELEDLPYLEDKTTAEAVRRHSCEQRSREATYV